MEKVSLLIPCYNDGRYLEEAFASIAAQTWPDLEAIVVDDGSDDDLTADVLRRLEAEGRAVVVRGAHQGPAAARNRAAAAATGDYLLPLDADDRIASTYVEKAMAVLRARPEVGVCYCRAELFGERSGPWALPAYSLREMLVDNVVFVTALMRREVFEQAGGFDESFRTGMEDYDFFLTALENGWEIVQLPETLFYYRIKPVSRSKQLMGDQRDYQAVYQRLFDKHRALYAAHWQEAIPALRGQLLAQRGQITALEERLLRRPGIAARVANKARKLLGGE